jgi:SAM-dependent methyltransferase
MSTNTAPNYLPEVRNQYENFPYPPINPEDDKKRLYMPVHEAFDALNYYCFGGMRDFSKPFRALVAGGGTGDAITALAEQFRDNPQAELVYVDMSTASMEVAKKRVAIRGLDNVRWINDSLLNIPKLGLGKFDYINCSGVLHHLSDPDAGLKVLADALADDGAMGIMVYAQYGRLAVYQMQEALRLLNRNEADIQQRVENAKTIVGTLYPGNWLYASPQPILGELRNGDIGIYDLLLHSQDRAYTVPQLYDFVEGAGLKLVHFLSEDRRFGNHLYSPGYYIKERTVLEKARTLPLRDQQALAELLNSKICRHIFYAAKTPPTRPDPMDMEMIPLLGLKVAGETDAICGVMRQAGDVVILTSEMVADLKVTLPKTPHMEPIFRHVDGKRTLREIFRKVMDTNAAKKDKPNFQTLSMEFAAMFQIMNSYDWLFLRGKDTAPVLNLDALQARVKAT